MIDIDRLADSYWAKYDPEHDDGRKECEICGERYCISKMRTIGRHDYVCPHCYENVKADEIDWAKRHGIDPTTIEGIYEEDIEDDLD